MISSKINAISRVSGNVLKLAIPAAIIGSTFAANDSHAKNAFNGWSVGGAAGYQYLSSQVTATSTESPDSEEQKPNPSGSGVVGQLNAAYSKTSNNWYFGGKIFVDTSSAKAKKTSALISPAGAEDFTNELTITKKYGVGVVGNLGRMLNPKTAVYGIFGLTYGKFKVKYNDTALGLGSSQTKNAIGFPLGVGVSRAISDSVRIYGEGTYTYYNRFTTKDLRTSDESYVAKISMREFNLLIGASYTF